MSFSTINYFKLEILKSGTKKWYRYLGVKQSDRKLERNVTLAKVNESAIIR